MKAFWTLLLLVVLPTSSWAQGGPTTPPPILKSPGKPPALVVPPGGTHTNGDGVTVANNPVADGGKGSAIVTPMNGGPTSSTSVTNSQNFNGSISGLDSNDSVVLGPKSNATVSGEGGTVSLSTDSVVNVTNTAAPGGPSTTVTVPGTSVTLSPGSSATFDT